MVYIGRGCESRGLPPSVWGNPWRVRDVGREMAIAKFADHLDSSDELRAALPRLAGKVLVCHCRLNQKCHGDVILDRLREIAGEASEEEDRDDGNLGPAGKAGDGPVGRGPPMQVLRKGVPRDVVDGGGLCSPGKWPLRDRRYPQGAAVELVREALAAEIREFERDLAKEGAGDLR
eukprot:10722329-Lingulodinium_polyedra.AAC.1